MVIAIYCMPNGELEKKYKSRVLKAGKNKDKARFNIKEVNKFELLEGNPYRVKIIYFDENMDEKYKEKLKLFEKIYKTQK